MLFNTIDAIDISIYKPILNLENKINLGEVQTSYLIAKELLNMLPSDVFTNKSLKWCEPGAGQGNISVVLFKKLVENLSPLFSSINECKTHIINSMITLIEINKTNESRYFQVVNMKIPPLKFNNGRAEYQDSIFKLVVEKNGDKFYTEFTLPKYYFYKPNTFYFDK